MSNDGERTVQAMPLPNWAPGSDIFAADLNKLVDGIRAASRPVQSPKQVAYGLGLTQMQMIVTVNNSQEYLTCRTWDGVDVGDIDYFVAKPPLLRQSYYDNGDDTFTDANGNTYDFTDIDTVTVTSEDEATTENWQVTQSYLIDDIVIATANIGQGIDSDEKLDWQDSNVDGRGWAVVS